MRVNTKYSANDKVWFSENGQIRQRPIHKITAEESHYSKGQTKVLFFMGDNKYPTPYNEARLFRTKIEAAQDWITSQGIDTNELSCKTEETDGLDIGAELNYAIDNWNAGDTNEVISALNMVLKQLEKE